MYHKENNPAGAGAADGIATSTAASGVPYTAPRRQIWGWAVGRVSEYGMIATYGQAMNIFSIGFGLSPVILGWCMMLPRLVDGVIDPIVGHLSDNTHTRWGRRKPFMIGGAFTGAFFLAILYWASPAWRPEAQFAYLFLVGTALYVCYGAFTMSWNAIGYELSDDYHERSQVAAIGGFVLATMALINSWIYWLALRPVFGDLVHGMRWIAGAMGVLIIAAAVISVAMTRERFTHANDAKVHIKLWPAIRATLKNRPFVILLLMKVCEIFGGRLTSGITLYLSVYYVCRGDQNLASRLAGTAATLGTVWNFAVLPLVKPASKWFGKRGALIVSAGIGLATAAAAPFITTPEHPYWGLIPGLIIAPLLVITSTIAGAVLPDICDVDELASGERREGLYTSVMAFVGKIEISLAVVLVGYIINWAALDTNITNRWQYAVDGTADRPAHFTPGESAVVARSDGVAQTFDTLLIDSTDRTAAIAISISDESPTSGFRPITPIKIDRSANTRQVFCFAATTAKFIKLVLGTGAASDSMPVRSVGFRDSTAPSTNAQLTGFYKIVAAEPPAAVLSHLYWLVMLPGMLFSILTFVATLYFPLTEKRMMQVRHKLDERRLARAASGIPTDTVAEQIAATDPSVVLLNVN